MEVWTPLTVLALQKGVDFCCTSTFTPSHSPSPASVPTYENDQELKKRNHKRKKLEKRQNSILDLKSRRRGNNWLRQTWERKAWATSCESPEAVSFLGQSPRELRYWKVGPFWKCGVWVGLKTENLFTQPKIPPSVLLSWVPAHSFNKEMSTDLLPTVNEPQKLWMGGKWHT